LSDGRIVGWGLSLGFLLSVNPTIRLSAQCPDGSPAPCRLTSHATTSPPANSVAVLYFDNLSPDTADAWLGDGLTEELITRLRQLARLTVRPATTVRRYRGQTGNPAGVGRALGVLYVVKGSVFPGSSRLRVSVALISAPTGARVWSAEYDRSTGDLLALQEDILREIATGIAGRLRLGERAALTAFPTRSRDAYDHFLHGLYDAGPREESGLLRALDEFEAATRIDSTFARAYARIGIVNGLLLLGNSGVAAETLIARGLAATDRALTLDPSLSDAWVARGRLLAAKYSPFYEGALAAYERAIALDPRNAEAYNFYGTALGIHYGDLARACGAYERAVALDPGHGVALGNLALCEFAGRRFREALRWSDSALAVTPANSNRQVIRAMVRLALGDTAGARADAQASLRLDDDLPWARATIALVDLRQGDTLATRHTVEKLVTGAGDPKSDRGTAVSTLLLALGEGERALDYLERVRPRRGFGFPLQLSYVFLDPLRTNPRFQRLVEESRPR